MATAEKSVIAEIAAQVDAAIDDLGPEDQYAALGGTHQVDEREGQLFDLAFRAEVNQQEKFPVWIPGRHAEFVQVNGLSYIINPEQIVMVPKVVKEILDNKKQLERRVDRAQEAMRKSMSASIHQIPEYVR